jgi:peptide/nickel transport system ATP-binding protein
MAIGLAVACDPDVIVLDEPTSGLDVVTQARILAEVARLCRDDERAAVFVSHDLAAMVSIAHRIAVMYAGRIVEEWTAAELIASPAHPYTAGLIASVPVHNEARALTGMPGIAAGVRDRPPGCSFAPRCPLRSGSCESSLPPLLDLGHQHRVRCIHWDQVTAPPAAPRAIGSSREATEPLLQVEHLRAVHGRGTQSVIAADDVSFTIGPGECLAVVGQSGSGKSTIARCVAGLHQPAAGTIRFGGVDVARLAKDRPATLRRQMQIVFQNPYDSLNPRRTVEDAIARPLALFAGMDAADRRAEVASLLERVRLPLRLARCLPRELSGGERQRVALARALAPGPQLLICDEVTSSLDVSVQAAVLDVLGDLDIAMLFITHDLGVVASVADSVVVLERGAVRASGPVEQVMGSPEDDYTRALLAAIPDLPLPSATGTR